jgi:hypothetical protein
MSEDEGRIRPWRPERIERDGASGRAGGGTGAGASESSGSAGGAREAVGNDGRTAFPGIEHVRRVSWAGLPLGSVILQAPTVGGFLPPELRDFPTVDRALRSDLQRRYHFLPNHPLTIATVRDPRAAERFAAEVQELDRRLRGARDVSSELQREYRRFGIDPGEMPGFMQPTLTESTRLVKDQYNSFSVNTALEGPIPTLLRSSAATDVSIGHIVSDLLAGRLRIPKDEPVTVHIVVDVSYSMKNRGRLDHAFAAANSLATQIGRVMRNTKIKGYQFSDTVRRVDLPTTRVAPACAGTRQAGAVRTLLRHRDEGRYNTVILMTDGEPEDYIETLRGVPALRDAGVDYTQILLHTDEDLRHEVTSEPGEFVVKDKMIADGDVDAERIRTLSDEEVEQRREGRFGQFTRIAEEAGGNQVVLTEFLALGLVTVELYDRYVGLLSLLR